MSSSLMHLTHMGSQKGLKIITEKDFVESICVEINWLNWPWLKGISHCITIRYWTDSLDLVAPTGWSINLFIASIRRSVHWWEVEVDGGVDYRAQEPGDHYPRGTDTNPTSYQWYYCHNDDNHHVRLLQVRPYWSHYRKGLVHLLVVHSHLSYPTTCNPYGCFGGRTCCRYPLIVLDCFVCGCW